ncbi:MAG: hypothetical protein CVT80_08350 [Alphaproteobacteria bacterium HGW-Alphaproteobacteria-2]|nr:MAG: hypothetical protein CVT80_08350 [Alphaproteobacteria bacterium HGW-Alphaproteobacteria-2]
MTAIATWPAAAETWLDARGKPAWIAAMVLGFILFWPVGLALLAYMIWSNRMSCNGKSFRSFRSHGFRPSGNTAFDTYKADTLRRLEEEQASFDAFLKRLRDSRDKAEFDAFLEEQRRGEDGPRPAGA